MEPARSAGILLRFVYNYQNKLESTRICTRITFCRGGSLFAAKCDPAGSIIATKSDPAGSLFTRINFCVTGTIGHPGGQQKKFLPFGHGMDLAAFNGIDLQNKSFQDWAEISKA